MLQSDCADNTVYKLLVDTRHKHVRHYDMRGCDLLSRVSTKAWKISTCFMQFHQYHGSLVLNKVSTLHIALQTNVPKWLCQLHCLQIVSGHLAQACVSLLQHVTMPVRGNFFNSTVEATEWKHKPGTVPKSRAQLDSEISRLPCWHKCSFIYHQTWASARSHC